MTTLLKQSIAAKIGRELAMTAQGPANLVDQIAESQFAFSLDCNQGDDDV